MPSGHVPEFSMTISPVASIVDPELVALPEEAKESSWVVSSKEVLLRYVENDDLMPEIDFAELDEIGIEALEEFEAIRDILNDNAAE
jgi:hypothetical protein